MWTRCPLLARAKRRLPAEALVKQTARAILDWALIPVRDDLCLLAMKPA
jgi:hypothetical protein